MLEPRVVPTIFDGNYFGHRHQTGHTQRRVGGVITHAAHARSNAREHILAVASDGVNAAQQSHGLRGQRHEVVALHLHFVARDVLLSLVPVDFFPTPWNEARQGAGRPSAQV